MTKPSDIAVVLPERIAPSQMMASRRQVSGCIHQLRTRRCFGENGTGFIMQFIRLLLRGIQRGKQCLCGGIRIRRTDAFQQAFQRFLTVKQLDLHTAALYPLDFGHLKQIQRIQFGIGRQFLRKDQFDGIAGRAKGKPKQS